MKLLNNQFMSFNTTRWALNRRNGTIIIFVEILVSFQTKFTEEKNQNIRSSHCNNKLSKIQACLCPITNITLSSTQVLKSAIQVQTPGSLRSLNCSRGCSSKTEEKTWLPAPRIPEPKAGPRDSGGSRSLQAWARTTAVSVLRAAYRDGKGAWGNRAKWLPFSAINPIIPRGLKYWAKLSVSWMKAGTDHPVRSWISGAWDHCALHTGCVWGCVCD